MTNTSDSQSTGSSLAAEIDYKAVAGGCPFAILKKMRLEAPVTKLVSSIESQVGYLVTRNQHVLTVARDALTFSSTGNPQAARWGDYNEEAAAIYKQSGWPLLPVLVWIDPPDHARFRRFVDRIFTPERVAAREEHIRICIDKLIAPFASGGSVEAIALFAAKLPAMVMTREFGAPEDDFAFFIEMTNTIGNSIDFTQGDPADADRLVVEAAHAVTKFQQYMLPRIKQARERPENTMLSELVNAKDNDGAALSTPEIMSILVIFLIAATHSTTGMVGWALHSLAAHQEIQGRLRREPAHIEAFVEEVLRIHGTVSTSYRTATKDTTVGDVKIPEGSQIFLRWDSANRDESRWPKADCFDVDRKGIRAHLAFGAGVHLCVGNTLARKEISMSVANFLDRFSHIAFNGDPQELASFTVHALTALPLALTV